MVEIYQFGKPKSLVSEIVLLFKFTLVGPCRIWVNRSGYLHRRINNLINCFPNIFRIQDSQMIFKDYVILQWLI